MTTENTPALPPRPPFPMRGEEYLGADVTIASNGFSGTVTTLIYFANGLLRADVEAPTLVKKEKRGKTKRQTLQDAVSVDIVQLDITRFNEDRLEPLNILPPEETHVYPGDKVKNRLTGAEGYVRHLARAMSGCIYAKVQELNPADPNAPKTYTIDCAELEVVQYDMLGIYAKGQDRLQGYVQEFQAPALAPLATPLPTQPPAPLPAQLRPTGGPTTKAEKLP